MPHIRTDNQPVTQITVIEPEPGKQAEALSLMTERARFMARQPGFISADIPQRSRGLADTELAGDGEHLRRVDVSGVQPRTRRSDAG